MYVQVEQNVPVHDGSSFKWERYDNPSSLEGLYTGIANLSSLIPPGATHYSFPWTDDDTLPGLMMIPQGSMFRVIARGRRFFFGLRIFTLCGQMIS
jgi:hypothetical protein